MAKSEPAKFSFGIIAGLVAGVLFKNIPAGLLIGVVFGVILANLGASDTPGEDETE